MVSRVIGNLKSTDGTALIGALTNYQIIGLIAAPAMPRVSSDTHTDGPSEQRGTARPAQVETVPLAWGVKLRREK